MTSCEGYTFYKEDGLFVAEVGVLLVDRCVKLENRFLVLGRYSSTVDKTYKP
jgi:hypothetical protein